MTSSPLAPLRSLDSLARGLVALVLMPWLALSSTFAPEHVHKSDDHHAIVHRHIEAHDHDGLEISHGEGRVIWLKEVAIAGASHADAPRHAVLSVCAQRVPALVEAIALMPDLAAPAHGPPRDCRSLRAPPARA